MACYNIMAVILSHRSKKANNFQEILTKHGCIIKMRLGLHEAGDVCSEEGLIILQLDGSKEDIIKLKDELNTIEGISASSMEVCS